MEAVDMKKIILLLTIVAAALLPTTGFAKLLLDLPPILTCNPACNPCNSTPTPECPDWDPCGCCNENVCNPCSGDFNSTTCVNSCFGTATCCSDSVCDPCSGDFNSTTCVNSCFDSECSAIQSLMNDTGITDKVGTGKQDADYGNDTIADTQPSDGHAGFSFTKLDSTGNALDAAAGTWVCVKDNVTGLIWSSNTVGTYPWSQIQAQADSSTLCGATDWRLPTVKELISIVAYNTTSPAVDANYFKDFSLAYWSGIEVVNTTEKAWSVSFSLGNTAQSAKTSGLLLRLVRTVAD
ncbi:MAG: DUF1566 domain-containing protein [Candidatus Electrothrix sp. AR3]|nr:DUF1566 domain-containing protein [Candidatus Electrothrix sp. AR3]